MRTSRLLALGAAAALAVSLTACASSAPTSTDDPGVGANPASDDAFPVTVEHVYGETTITEKPERVASVAWANHEVPLALDVVPVGMSKVAWGDDDDNGVLPWVEDKLEELGADTPVLFDEADGIDFEAVADTSPDVILASYSGLTQEDYDTLSKIAPTIAYPEVAWGTAVDDMITMNATALGLADEGQALVDDLQAQTDAALEAHPALQDAKLLFTYIDPNDFSQLGFYTPIDTRPGFLLDQGLPEPDILKDYEDSTEFYVQVSAEQVEKFDDVDVFITYGDESMIEALQADPLLGKIPAIAKGQIAILPDATPMANSANPSPLSIPWGIDEYFSILEAPLTAQ
ncbi:iron-siderophore ABC transporter substrate-binding protein [Microbacterium sp.]|uniref:iron-siderophore ABC transporter substrate-binding protein n=1 Tax=Microbacterium sp. TaxID=51671 RepID=UPI003F9A1338